MTARLMVCGVLVVLGVFEIAFTTAYSNYTNRVAEGLGRRARAGVKARG